MAADIGSSETRDVAVNACIYLYPLVTMEGPVGRSRTSVRPYAPTSVDGGPMRDRVIRVTHIYRRIDGDWKLVDRHPDFPPVGRG